MPAYLVELPDAYPGPLVGGHNKMVVFAEDAAAARAMAAATEAEVAAVNETAWKDSMESTVTEIAAAADLLGFVLRISISGAAAQTVDPVEVTYTGIASDLMDDMGAGAVIALNALADVANAAYNATTNVLTVAGAGDGLGDGTVVATFEWNGIDIDGAIGTITHEGTAGAALTVGLAADAFALPAIYASLKE